MLHCYKNVKHTNKMNSQKRKKRHQNQIIKTINYVKVLQQFTKHKEQRQLDGIY